MLLLCNCNTFVFIELLIEFTVVVVAAATSAVAVASVAAAIVIVACCCCCITVLLLLHVVGPIIDRNKYAITWYGKL